MDRITFVPKKDFSGTVDIPFTGWSSAGEKFYGTVIIGVDSGDTTIRYQTKYGKPAAFADGDFDDLSELLTGEHLNYVRFNCRTPARALSTTTTMTGNTPARCPPAGITTAPAAPIWTGVSFVPDEISMAR